MRYACNGVMAADGWGGSASLPAAARPDRPIVRFTSHVGATTEKERKAREKEESIRGNGDIDWTDVE